MHPTPQAAQRERWLLLALAGVQFTHIVDFMVMMPLGPQLTRLFAISDAQFGLLVSAYTLAAGASGLIAVSYIDRFERKRLLLWLYAGFALATLACGLAPSYAWLMAARIAAGAFGGVLGALVQTMVADAVPFERRGRAMGVVMSSFALSTVAGVPASLWLAQGFDWHAPFVAIAALSAGFWALGLRVLPRLDSHLQAQRGVSALTSLGRVLAEPNHWTAFALSAMVMGASFVIIPYITLYGTANVRIAEADIPLIYLVGGAATFFTARLWGVLADRYGKLRVFQALALAALVPMMTLTHLGPVPLWAMMVVTTGFFVFVSGRNVPDMALISGAARPELRGSFLSLNGSVQSAAMGLAALVGGLLISRDPQGLVQGYGKAGWVALGCTAAALWLAARLRVPEGLPVKP
jgi:predicted MFS family arabinose efflux permease